MFVMKQMVNRLVITHDYDPVVLTLEKADKERNALNAGQYGPQGNASLVGAVFTLTLYEENNLTEAQNQSRSRY